MKYTVQSSKYILKNFLYIFPFAIIPAFCFSLATDKEALRCAMETIFSGRLKELHFEHLFRAVSVLNFASWKAVVFGLIGIVVIIVCTALLLALLEKHMRFGKRTFNGVFSKLNDNLVSTCSYAFLLLALYEFWCLITSALLFSVMQIPVMPIAYVLGGLVFIGMHIVLISIIGAVYLWLPCMQITGFKALEAFHYSYHLMSPIKGGILIGQLLFLFVAEALICLCAVFSSSYVVFMALTTAFYAVLMMVFCVRMQVAYFDRDNIERADLKTYYR